MTEEGREPTGVEWKEHRKWLVETGYQVSRDFDKAAMTISSGGIVVSLAFIEKVLHGTARSPAWLEASWICFGGGLLATFISLLTSQAAMSTAAYATDQESPSEDDLSGGRWGTLTIICNIVTGVLVIAGVTCLLLFAGANLDQIQGGTSGKTG